MKYYGKINCTIDSDHPDFKYIDEWREDKIFTFSDTYTFNEDCGYTEEDRINYIKRDLKLVAGGGYDTTHIHNITFEIVRQIEESFHQKGEKTV